MRPGYTQALPYSHAVETSGRLLFISGQGPVSLDGKVIEADRIAGFLPGFPGICAKRVNPAGTSVLVDIVSTVSHGGPQAPA